MTWLPGKTMTVPLERINPEILPSTLKSSSAKTSPLMLSPRPIFDGERVAIGGDFSTGVAEMLVIGVATFDRSLVIIVIDI